MRIVSTSEGSGQAPDATPDLDVPANKTEPNDEAKAKAKEMAKAYDERPTAVLPGSNGTITGTAVNDWLDDDGNPIYGRDNNIDGRGQS